MNLMIQPNQICLIVKLYNNRPELLPDSHDINIQMIKFSLLEETRAGAVVKGGKAMDVRVYGLPR